MNKKLSNSTPSNLFKLTNAPIMKLRNIFKDSLRNILTDKIHKEIEQNIVIDLPPAHVKTDFTFPVFEIAKAFKVNHIKLAAEAAKKIETYKKYISNVQIVNGYINVRVNAEIFYKDSLLHSLNESLLKEPSRSNKTKTVLLLPEQMKINDSVNQPAFKFITHLFSLPPYVVKTAAINHEISLHKIRIFVEKAIKYGKVKNFGSNVIAVSINPEKYSLLQKQNKTPTLLLSQLVSLDNLIRKNHPNVVIFSLNIDPKNINELLESGYKLDIFKRKTQIVILNDSDIENQINFHHFNRLKKLNGEIRKIIQEETIFDSKDLNQFTDKEVTILRFIAYAPEIYRQLFFRISPKVLIRYIEFWENDISEFYRSIKNSVPSERTVTQKLLLEGIYKFLDTSLNLIGE